MAVAEIEMREIKIGVRMPRAYGFRLWLSLALLKLAGFVGPHPIEVSLID